MEEREASSCRASQPGSGGGPEKFEWYSTIAAPMSVIICIACWPSMTLRSGLKTRRFTPFCRTASGARRKTSGDSEEQPLYVALTGQRPSLPHDLLVLAAVIAARLPAGHVTNGWPHRQRQSPALGTDFFSQRRKSHGSHPLFPLCTLAI